MGSAPSAWEPLPVLSSCEQLFLLRSGELHIRSVGVGEEVHGQRRVAGSTQLKGHPGNTEGSQKRSSFSNEIWRRLKKNRSSYGVLGPCWLNIELAFVTSSDRFETALSLLRMT